MQPVGSARGGGGGRRRAGARGGGGVAALEDLAHALRLLQHVLVVRLELQALLERAERRAPAPQAHVRGAAPRVALGPRGIQADALVRVEQRLLELAELGVRRRAVGEQHLVARVVADGL
eukprot:3227494-Prymnesium_polylepis.1